MTETQIFEINLARVLACTLVHESREAWLPVADAMMDDDAAPDVGEQTRESVDAWVAGLPALVRAMADIMPYAEKGRLNATRQTAPGFSQLQTDLYRQFAPQLAETSRDIDRQNRLSGAQTDADVLAGPGEQITDSALGLLRRTDPEFFNVREKTAGSIMDLLSGGLTPAEEEAINRRILQDDTARGLNGVQSATRTTSNAMQFGNAARQRQLQGVQAASSFLPVSRTNFDPTQLALGRPSINTGDSRFMGVQPLGNQVENTGNNFFNQVAGFQNNAATINAQRRDWMDRVNEGVGSINF